LAVELARSRLSWWLRVPVGYTVVFACLVASLVRASGSALPGRPNFCDSQFITWVFSWVHHSLVNAPARVFDANINYPAPGQLTGSEHFFSTQLVFAPLLWLTGNPVLATNLVAFISYPLAAIAMERLLSALGYARPVAWLAGLVFALGPLRVPFNVHVVQYLNFYLPLVALLLVRLRDDPVPLRVLPLALALAAGALSSYYLALMLALVAAVWAVCEFARPGSGRLRFLWLAAGAALVVVAMVALLSAPYFHRPTVDRGPSVVVANGWWPGFDPTPWGLQGYPPRYQRLAVGLGLLALLARVPGTARAIVPALVFVPMGTLLMYGFPAPLARLVVNSPLGFIQWPHRFAVVAGFGDALLVASGLQAIGWWAGSRILWLATAAFAGAILTRPALRLGRAEMVHIAPLGTDRHVYEEIARMTGPRAGALLELPFILSGKTRCITSEAASMVGSTIHWLPLVGGYSGYQPPHRGLLIRTAKMLPAPWAINDLIDMTHVRWVLLRPAADWGSDTRRRSLERGLMSSPALGPPIYLGVPGWTLFPVVRGPMHPEWFAAIASGWQPHTTVLGTALAPIAEKDAIGAVEGVLLPQQAFAGFSYSAGLRVLNEGGVTWPTSSAPNSPMKLAITFEDDIPDAYRVVLASRWRSLDTGVQGEVQQQWLRRDLAPGEMLTDVLTLSAPQAPGTYELEVRLHQIDGARFDDPGNRVLRAMVSVVEAPPTAGDAR